MEYLHDIFISYPSPLNETPYPRWVERFEEALRRALSGDLRHTTGLKREPNIYFDARSVEANSNEEDMLEAAARSRLFLAIVSPDYQMREWAPRELSAFPASAIEDRRLFIIATKPLPKDDVTLARLRKPFFKPFYANSSLAQGHPMPFYPGEREFNDGVYGLAVSMAKKLGEMAGGDASTPTTMRATAPAKTGARTILLAHVSDDLDVAREGQSEFQSVASELEQYCGRLGVRLISGADYPMGGDAFREAFDADLAQANLVVQLLGATMGKRPRDLPEGYVAYQARRAQESAGVKLMQWRRSDLDVESLEDPDLRALLQGEMVTASTLAAFKNDLIAWIETPPTEETQTKKLAGIEVFINAEDADWEAAERCREALQDYCVSIYTRPQARSGEASAQAEFNRLVKECDPLIFINGNAEESALGHQMSATLRVRVGMQKLDMSGVRCDGPPPGKPPFYASFRGIQPVNCTTTDGSDWQFDGLLEYLRRRSAG